MPPKQKLVPWAPEGPLLVQEPTETYGELPLLPARERNAEANTFIIPGELYSSKNSRRPVLFKNGSGRNVVKVVKSDAAKRQETSLCAMLNAQPRFCELMRTEISQCDRPLRLEMTIYRRTNQRFDYNNISQNLLDCLVKTGILEDDNASILIPVYTPYKVDHDEPRTELRFL